MRKIFLSILTLFSMSLFGYITVTSPNGGETLYRGTSFVIKWNDNISEDVRIDLYQNGSFLAPIVSSTPSDGSYTAEIPNELYGANFKIRITSTTTPTTYDYSDGYFTIDIGYINLLTPAGGESLYRGQLFEITWNSSNFQENVLITLNDSGTPIDTIAVSAVNDGSYSWYSPTDVYGNNFSVRIKSKLYSSIYNESPYFTIEEGFITLNNPVGGEVFEMLTDTLITWDDNIQEDVIIEIRKAGVIKKTFYSASSGFFRWNYYDPELTTGSDYSIRIRSALLSTLYSESGHFTIKGTPLAGGSISGTWAEANSPYIISDSVFVDTPNTLTIEAGAELNNVGIGNLKITGKLDAAGISGNFVKLKNTMIDFYNSGSPDSSKIYYSLIERRPVTSIEHYYGGPEDDEGNCVLQTQDGGYIITGYTKSYGAGEQDIYVVKTDSKGNQLWYKTHGGPKNDCGNCIIQTNDGGYIIAGETLSDDKGYQVYIIKIDLDGNELWSKTYGGINNETARSIIRSSKGGYIIAGETSSYGAGLKDIYLIKIDLDGNELWSKTFGGTNDEYAGSLIETAEGDYLIVGYTMSFASGFSDAYLIKTDGNGNELWSKTFGGSGTDSGNRIIQSDDGSYVLCGSSWVSTSLDRDIYIVKTDIDGNELWSKTYGGIKADYGSCIAQTPDGGYIISGFTLSYGAGSYDGILIRTDSLGRELFSTTFGGLNSDQFLDITKSSDGYYVLTGRTNSFGSGNNDVLLIKTTGFDSYCLNICEDSKLVISNTIVKNIDEFGIIIDNASPVISNNLITGNRHGIKLTGSSSQYIVNNTIADNDSIGVFLNGNSDPQFISNIIYGNGVHQVYLNDDLSDPAFYYNNIQGGVSGFGLNSGVTYSGSYSNNIEINPFFVSGTYELQDLSQCRNAGYPGLTEQSLGSLYLPQTDMKGSGRLSGTEIDIGCYEYFEVIITPDSPANVVITASVDSLRLDWDDMPNANSYLIYSSDDPYGTFDYLATVSQSQWSITIGTDTKKFYNVVSSSENAKNIKPEPKKNIQKTSSNK